MWVKRLGGLFSTILKNIDIFRSEVDKNAEIAVYSSDCEGCGIIYNLLSARFRVTYVYSKDIIEGDLKYKVLILPGGSNHVLTALKFPEFTRNIESYVKRGGKLLGICGGTAVSSLVGFCETNWFGLIPYHLYYSFTKTKSVMRVKWRSDNIFGFPENSTSSITWAAGPYINPTKNLKAEAIFTENKPLISSQAKIAVASGHRGDGKIILFSPHPEYPCPYPSGSTENQNLILKAIEWLLSP